MIILSTIKDEIYETNLKIQTELDPIQNALLLLLFQ